MTIRIVNQIDSKCFVGGCDQPGTTWIISDWLNVYRMCEVHSSQFDLDSSQYQKISDEEILRIEVLES